MNSNSNKVVEASDFIKDRIEHFPKVALITGTGLGDIVDALTVESTIDYMDIPHFPKTTVESHRGRLVFGRLGERQCLVLQGRFHLYEGYSPKAVTFPIRVLQQLGITHLMLSNAAGGLNTRFEPGDIMLISDHINLTGSNPLIGPNDDRWGARFPDMARAYDPEGSEAAVIAAGKIGIPLRKGVYAGLTGPSLETPAEVRYLRVIGADAVGFSTVMEAIAAVHAGMRVIGLSTITNVHDPDNPIPASVPQILETAGNTAPRLSALLREIVARLNP